MKRYLDVMKSEIRKFKEFQKWFDKYIKKNYGKKCPEFNWHCHSCHANFVKDLFDDFVEDIIDTENWLKKTTTKEN